MLHYCDPTLYLTDYYLVLLVNQARSRYRSNSRTVYVDLKTWCQTCYYDSFEQSNQSHLCSSQDQACCSLERRSQLSRRHRHLDGNHPDVSGAVDLSKMNKTTLMAILQQLFAQN